MKLFRPVEKPTAWPPPRTREATIVRLDYARRRDPIGHEAHAALGMITLASMPFSTAPYAILFPLLVLYAVIRLPTTWRTYPALLRDPLVWLLIAWAAWQSLSMLWSCDAGEGLESFGTLRVTGLTLALWPVIDRAPHLIAGFLAGVALSHGAQLAQGLGWIEAESSVRLGGMIHPIQQGGLCLAALTWHAGGALTGRRWMRIVSVVGAALALAGLLATGSRGPWLAALIALPIGLIGMAWRAPAVRRDVIIVAIAGVLGVAALWPVFGGAVTKRVTLAVDQASAAWTDEAYATDIGLRIGMWRWAGEIFRQDPIAGGGVGSFRDTIATLPSYQEAVARTPQRASYLSRDQAHSTPLHTAATQGLVGLGLLAAVLTIMTARTWRDRRDHLYAAANWVVALGWLVGMWFETYTLQTKMLSVMMLAGIASWPMRPPNPARWAATRDDSGTDSDSERTIE